MTHLSFGSRLDAIEYWKRKQKVEFFYFDEKSSKEESAHDFYMAWNGETLPPSHIVFICPPGYIRPDSLEPRKTRHVLFEDELPASWKTWATKHKIKPQNFEKSSDYLIAGLTAGAMGLPRFTDEAAKHLVACCPGGLQAIWWPCQQIKSMEYPEPISLEHAIEAWPFVVTRGKSYTVSLGSIMKSLGTKEAIQLVCDTTDKEAFGGLMGLKVACHKHLNRLEWLNKLIQGVEDKRWTPKAALLIFTHLCLVERNKPSWPSQNKTLSLSSPALTQLYQLLGIPF